MAILEPAYSVFDFESFEVKLHYHQSHILVDDHDLAFAIRAVQESMVLKVSVEPHELCLLTFA